jgi:hypothetical protein
MTAATFTESDVPEAVLDEEPEPQPARASPATAIAAMAPQLR